MKSQRRRVLFVESTSAKRQRLPVTVLILTWYPNFNINLIIMMPLISLNAFQKLVVINMTFAMKAR